MRSSNASAIQVSLVALLVLSVASSSQGADAGGNVSGPVPSSSLRLAWKRDGFYAQGFNAGLPGIVTGFERDGTLVALNSTTGAELWRRKLARAPAGVAGWCVANSTRVVVSTNQRRLYGIALDTGKIDWARSLDCLVPESPAVSEGFLLGNCIKGMEVEELDGSPDDVFAFDLGRAGRKLWSQQASETLEHDSFGAPLAVDGQRGAFVKSRWFGKWDHILHRRKHLSNTIKLVDMVSGKLLREIPTDVAIASLALTEGVILAASACAPSKEKLAAYDAQTGSELWRDNCQTGGVGSRQIARATSGSIFVARGRVWSWDSDGITAFDVSTGREAHRWTLAGGGYYARGWNDGREIVLAISGIFEGRRATKVAVIGADEKLRQVLMSEGLGVVLGFQDRHVFLSRMRDERAGWQLEAFELP